MRVRSRLCNNPYPGFGGAPCVGEEREVSALVNDLIADAVTLLLAWKGRRWGFVGWVVRRGTYIVLIIFSVLWKVVTFFLFFQ